MSNNAVAAYEDGEMPLSKWTKSAILDAVQDISVEAYNLVKDLPLQLLKDKLLTYSSWHHTSSMYNRTDFYSIDEDVISNLNQDTIDNWKNDYTPAKNKKEPSNIKKGNISYIVWTGTRKHPTANKKYLSDVNIEERGQFYIVTDDNGKEILRKKIGSNGTYVSYNK